MLFFVVFAYYSLHAILYLLVVFSYCSLLVILSVLLLFYCTALQIYSMEYRWSFTEEAKPERHPDTCAGIGRAGLCHECIITRSGLGRQELISVGNVENNGGVL